jgi:hypothetical protein
MLILLTLGDAYGTFTIDLTTYSIMNEYRFKSATDYEALTQITDRAMSYEEWVAVANAGFR